MDRMLFAFCITLALSSGVCAQCPAPHFHKGRDFINPDSGSGSLYVSVGPRDFVLNKLICLGQTLRKHHPGWKDVSILVFSSADAADSFQASYADYEDRAAWTKWTKQLHVVYSFDAQKLEEYLDIMPLGYNAAPSYNTRIDLPLAPAPHCRLEIRERCVIALGDIGYLPNALEGRTTGRITATGTINPNGRVTAVRAVEADVSPREKKELLANMALRDLKSWRFDAGKRNDSFQIVYSFSCIAAVVPGNQPSVQFDLPGQVVIHAWNPRCN